MILRDVLMLATLMLIGRNALAQPEEVPSLEFLEFLGAWEDQAGEWLDPTAILGEDDAQNSLPNQEEDPEDYDD